MPYRGLRPLNLGGGASVAASALKIQDARLRVLTPTGSALTARRGGSATLIAEFTTNFARHEGLAKYLVLTPTLTQPNSGVA